MLYRLSFLPFNAMPVELAIPESRDRGVQP